MGSEMCIRDSINTAGGNASAVQVVITDVEKEDWAAGGELMLDKYPD